MLPFLKFVYGCLKIGEKWVDRWMIWHHLFMENSALIGVFGLDEDRKFSKEGPRVEIYLTSIFFDI